MSSDTLLIVGIACGFIGVLLFLVLFIASEIRVERESQRFRREME